MYSVFGRRQWLPSGIEGAVFGVNFHDERCYDSKNSQYSGPPGEGVVLQAPNLEENVMTYVEGFMSVYTGVLVPGFLDWVVLDSCKMYQVTLA